MLNTVRVLLGLALISLLVFAAGSLARKKNQEDDRRWVKIMTLAAREQPAWESDQVFDLYYADPVVLIGRGAGWGLVRPTDSVANTEADLARQGWVSLGSLTHQELVMTLPDRKTRKRLADPEEPTLAGRSLRQEIGQQLAKLHHDRQGGYEQLDAFLDRPDGEPSPTDVLEFRRQGGLPLLPGPEVPEAGR